MTGDPIIPTKINLPRSRADVVIRPRIMEILNESVTRTPAMTKVSAPAGYGKTALLVSWLCRTNHPVAWLSLEPEDDTFPRFISYLVASLQKVNPSIGKMTEQILKNFGNGSPQTDSMIASLIKELEIFVQPVILVLEDYHYIKSSMIHKFIEALVEHAQPYLSLIISTRHDPPLPLARWRTRYQLIEIRSAELQFNLDESSEFLKRVMELDISDEEISLLEERTEGWVAGLQLAGLSIRNQRNKSNTLTVEGSHRDIADYLMFEVLKQLPKPQRDFLLQTSIVNRLSASLCNSVTGRDDSQPMLESLEIDNLFIVALDDKREWFRYHQLFAEFLRKQLLAEYPENRVKELHQRASHWLAEPADILSAIDHALAAKDYEYAACLIDHQAELWMRRGETSTILNKLTQLPERLIWKKYGLCLWYGWILAQTDHPESAESWTDRAEILIRNCFPDPADSHARNGLGQVLAIRALVARRKSDTTQAVELSQRALDCIPQDNLNLKTVISANLYSALLESGDFDQMEASLRAVQHMAKVAANPYMKFLMLANQSALAMMRGQLHLAHDINLQILHLTESEGLSQLAPLPHIRLGRVSYFWNDLAQARQHINTGLQLSTPVEHAPHMAKGYMTLAFIENAEGQFESALKMLDKGKHIAQENGLTSWAERLEACKARLQLSAGEMDAVLRWAKSSRWESFNLLNKSNPVFNDESFFTFCRYLIALENSDEWNRVGHLLEWRLRDAERQNRGSTILEIRLMQAALYQAQNNPEHGLIALTQALSLAEPEKVMRPFLDAGDSMALLLSRLPHSHPVRGFARQILLSFSTVTSKYSHGLVESLNDQEMNILCLIAQGLSNPEIARKRILAVSTVRWYVKQIYQKLGVHNRTQAAVQARELNLL